jgi:hypothetical protein
VGCVSLIAREWTRDHVKETQMGAMRKQMDDDMVVRHLKVGDIDSARMTIRVKQGKGAKDR